MLKVVDVHKTFRQPWWRFAPPVSVLKGCSMEAGPGEIVGIVGPNGAGKTTLFRLLAGLLLPDQGALELDGVDPVRDPVAARGRLALMPEVPNIGRMSTGYEHLDQFAILNGFPVVERRRRLDFVIDAFGLADFIHREGKDYSRGQQVRVSVARLALTDARILIFDEPTVGLDFESAGRVRAFIRSRAAQGHTVLIASHIVSDVASLCSRVLGLHQGVLGAPEIVPGWSNLAVSRQEGASA